MSQERGNRTEYAEIWRLIGNTRDMIYRLREKELLQNCSLPIRESMVLVTIDDINAEGRDVIPAELARRLIRKPNTTAYILDRMEKRGLIKQTKDLARKNLIKVTMTEKGKQAFACSQRRESIREIMDNLSPEEIASLKTILTKLRSKLFEMTGKNPNKRTG